MKNTVLLFLICLMSQLSFAQTKNPKTVSANLYESSLKTTFNQIRMVMNAKAPQTKLTGTGTPKLSSTSANYEQPGIVFPAALSTTLSLSYSEWQRNTGLSHWTWTATLLEFIKGAEEEKIDAEFKLLCEAMTKLYPNVFPTQEVGKSIRKLYTLDDMTVEVYNSSGASSKSLYINLSFALPILQTKQKIVDSLNKVLQSDLALSYLPPDKASAVTTWAKKLYLMGLRKEEIQPEGIKWLQKLAAADINIAYEILMDWPEYLGGETQPMLATLSATQQDAIKERAKKQVDDYYDKMYGRNKPAPIQTTTPPDKWPVFKNPEISQYAKTEQQEFYNVVANDIASTLKEKVWGEYGMVPRFESVYSMTNNPFYNFHTTKEKFVIVFYNNRSHLDNTSRISVRYDNGNIVDDKRITGANCTLSTNCTGARFCKTTCTGKLEGWSENQNYYFELDKASGVRTLNYLWTVLIDNKK